MTNRTRAVIDTANVISAVLLPRSIPRQAFDRAAGRGRLIISLETLAELNDVFRRPKFDKYVNEDKRLEFLAALVKQAELVEVSEVIKDCRDAKDNKGVSYTVS